MATRTVVFPNVNELGVSMQPSLPPTQPYNDYFGGMTLGAPAGANAFNMGIFGNSDVFNTNGIEQGLRSQEVIPHHFVMAPNLNPKEAAESAAAIRSLGLGMLLFARKHTADMNSNNGAYIQSAQVTVSDSTEFLEWTQLARWLANHSDRYEEPMDVLREWKFAGGLKVEVAPNQRGNYGNRAASRGINATVRGPFETFNIWNNRLRPGQPVFFIVVKGPADSCFAGAGNIKPVPGHYQTAGFDFVKYWRADEGDQRTKRARMNEAAKEKEVEKVKNYVWKIVPWTHHSRTKPDARELMYDDVVDGKIVRMVGTYIRVGYALYADGMSNPGAMRTNGDYANTIGLFNRGLLSQCEICLGV